MSYSKRDLKDPRPTADNSQRSDGGNVPYPSGAESHGQKKSMKVTSDQNRSTGSVAAAVDQPTRQGGDGNIPVTGESHGQKKATKVTESQRW